MVKITAIVIGFFLFLPTQQSRMPTRESRELRMADQAVLASIAVAASPAGKKLCTANKLNCVGPDKGELGLALIGARQTRMSRTALLNLLGYQLDGSLDEDYRCYVLAAGPAIGKDLAQVRAPSVETHCQDELHTLIASRKDSFEGLDISSVCTGAPAIEKKASALRSAVSKGEKCDSGDF